MIVLLAFCCSTLVLAVALGVSYFMGHMERLDQIGKVVALVVGISPLAMQIEFSLFDGQPWNLMWILIAVIWAGLVGYFWIFSKQ